MCWRALRAALFVLLVSCAPSDKPGEAGEAGEAGGTDDTGETTTGGASAGGSRGGSRNGGNPQGGDAGDDQAGSSGTSQGGTGGGRGGSAGDGGAGTGGQDSGEGTVTGVVRTDSGAPHENVLIAIGSVTTRTDEDGRFEIPDVAPVYDLVLVVAEEEYALVLHGVSERTLTLSAPGSGTFRTASIAGVVTGGAGTPIPTDCWARAAFQGSSIEVSGLFDVDTVLDESDASYWVDPFWYGPANVAGFLYALEHRRDANYRTTSYDGFGSKPFGISDRGVYGLRDGSIPATTIELAPVASRTVSGTITVPPGFSPRLEFWVGLFQTDIIIEPEDTYSNLVPTGLAGIQNLAVLSVGASVDPADGASYATYLIEDAVTTLDLSTPEAPAVSILPATQTLGVDYDTEFSWEPPAESVSVLLLLLGPWVVDVVMNASSATIPDLTEYGVVHPPGGPGIWRVQSVIGPTTVDEWLRLTADRAAYLNDHGKIEGTVGAGRTFNFAN